jgi:hypothetical protein
MAFDLSSVTRGPRPAPLRLMVFGVHGVGKTTFAAQAPEPILICTEDGLGMLETPAFPLVSSFDDAISCLASLHADDHDFRTVILDSADWLDNIIQREVRETHSEKELSYGKDMLLFSERWRAVLDWLNALRRDRAMHSILISHCEIKKFDPPDGESYERYQPKLPARSSALIQEWADAVLFANFRTLVKSEEPTDARRKPTKKALATGERLLHTGEKPAHLAKNRYSLPETLPLDWAAFAAAMPFDI